jgi:hypothetical protein
MNMLTSMHKLINLWLENKFKEHMMYQNMHNIQNFNNLIHL